MVGERQLAGRPETGQKDAQQLARLAGMGLLRPSFVPPPEVRALRDLTRTRQQLVKDRTREWRRLEKLLEGALVKLSPVVHSMAGTKTARGILEAIAAGERDPVVLAAMTHGNVKGGSAAVAKALEGMLPGDHHRRGGGQAGICGDLVPGLGGLYCVSMVDDWRVCIGLGDLPRSRHSSRKAVITELGSRLGDQVAVSSNATQIFVYAPSIGLADEAAQVAREVLAQRNISVGTVRTEGWSWREQEWRDADEMPADPAPDRQEQERARHAHWQEQERERSASTGLPAWQVRVELPSHRDVVALAGHLAAQGWRVRRRPRSLIVWANCEDDATGLARALTGDGSADADPVIRVARVSLRSMYMYGWTAGSGGSGV